MRQSRLSSVLGHGFSYTSALVFIIPVYVLVNLAFRPVDDLSSPLAVTSNPTLDNLSVAWAGSDLGSAILTSTIVTTVSCMGILVLATMAAYPLARSTARLSSATFYLFLIGLLVPFQIAMLPLYIAMKDLGLLGSVWSLILMYWGGQMPFAIFLLTTFLRNTPPEYEEAARIDGASDIKAFVYVVVPMLRPVLGTLFILAAVGIWNDFLVPLLYLVGSGNATIPMALNSFVGQYSTQWPVIFAGLLVSMAPILTLYLIFQRFVIQGFAGGLKG